MRRFVHQVCLGEFGVKVCDRFVRVDIRFERGRDRSLGEQLPVNVLEEGVLLQLSRIPSRSETVFRVSVEELTWILLGSQSFGRTGGLTSIERTHSFNKLLSVFSDYTAGELDLAETAVRKASRSASFRSKYARREGEGRT